MPLGGQAGFEVRVAGRAGEIARDLFPGHVQVRALTRPLLAAQHAGATGDASVGRGLAGEPEEVSRILAQAQLALLGPERLLNGPHGELDLPHPAGPRVDAVDHQVEVRVLAVVVRDDDGLVRQEPEVGNEPVRDPAHQCPVHRVGGIEAHRQVIDRLSRPRRRSESRHDRRGVVDRRCPDVLRLQPLDAAGLRAVRAQVKVDGELPEAGPVRFVADHRSVTAARISRSAFVAASASAPNPAAFALSIISWMGTNASDTRAILPTGSVHPATSVRRAYSAGLG